jgi:hypothetical protein
VVIEIDLSNVETKQDLLLRFGEVLELGGPNGNFQIKRRGARKGWGVNWDALLDSLCCLDSGGIWGTSKRLEFPLTLVVTNYQRYQELKPKEMQVLREILGHVAAIYAQHGMSFQYEFR